MVNLVPFPRSEMFNVPECVDAPPKEDEIQEVSSKETLSQIFDSIYNGPIDEEELYVDEVHMFHQRATPYYPRNR